MSVDLTPEERAALVILLTVEIEASKYPLSPADRAAEADQGKAARKGAGRPDRR
jgi:hypothetical protein